MVGRNVCHAPSVTKYLKTIAGSILATRFLVDCINLSLSRKLLNCPRASIVTGMSKGNLADIDIASGINGDGMRRNEQVSLRVFLLIIPAGKQAAIESKDADARPDF